MKTPTADHFERQYQTHLKHLKLKGLQPKTIEAYARAIRRIGNYFDHHQPLLPYASRLRLSTHDEKFNSLSTRGWLRTNLP